MIERTIHSQLAVRVYRLALGAFPPRHRAMYAAEMIDTFDRERAARRRSGGAARALCFTLAACLNVVSAGLSERRRYRRAGLGYAAAAPSWIDVRLAWRMLIRYPGLSVVSIFGLGVGIAIAAAASTVVHDLLDPVLPLPEGDRMVAIVTMDTATTNREPRVMHDFAAWRALTSVEQLGASVTTGRTLIAEGRQPEAVSVAEMTAAGFRVARVEPKIGRYLLEEDERPGSPDVVVIGHDVWTRRFDADPNIVGRQLQLGRTTHVIVGVMPEGFQFPVNHAYWIPWRLDPSRYEPRTGPTVTVFGRLAAGASFYSAQSELASVHERVAAGSPQTHRHLQSRVVPYAYAFNGMADPDQVLAVRAMQIAIVVLLAIVCVNVAILVYARTATREGEIAIRTALGASRRRIVMQLFVEALALAGVAAAVGLGLVSIGFDYFDAALRQLTGPLPFWMTFRVSADSVLNIVGLTLLAAAIVGLAPALKATGRHVQGRLQGLSAGGGSRMQLGRLWTLLIVFQVAFTVALLPAALHHAWEALRFRTGDPGFASQDFLGARLAFDSSEMADGADDLESDGRRRYAARQAELERRLEEEAPVDAVTFALTNPGDELAAILEIEGETPPSELVNYNIVEGTKQGHLVRFNRVAVDFFDAFDVPMVMGRALRPGDQGILVNRTMADTLFGGVNPLGRRVRYVGRSREAPARDVELNRWFEIVGVVPDFPIIRGLGTEPVSRLYHAASPGDVYPSMLLLRIHGSVPSTFAGRFREITAAVDPGLQLRAVSSVEDAMKREQGVMRVIGVTVALVMLSVVILSAAGIYAMMSFTVSRRRKEIGIRAALGADRQRILIGIFSRAFGQLAAGALTGMLGAVCLERLLEGEMMRGQDAVLLPIVAVFMTTVGVLAALGPARRVLGIPPTEALREE